MFRFYISLVFVLFLHFCYVFFCSSSSTCRVSGKYLGAYFKVNMNWIMSLLSLCHGEVRAIWNLEWGLLRPDVSDNRIQLSNYTAHKLLRIQTPFSNYRHWLHSDFTNLKPKIQTQNSNPKSNIVHIPRTWIRIPLFKPSGIQFLNSKSNIHIGRIWLSNPAQDSGSDLIIKLFAHLCFTVQSCFCFIIGIGKML